MTKYRRGWSRGWKKSPRGVSGEWFDSSWELQYMKAMEEDPLVARWTRHHDLKIPYGKWWGARGFYEPDFLVELADGGKEIREVKGGHLFADRNTAKKLAAGERFCRARGMTFKVITKESVNPELWGLSEEIIVEEVDRSIEKPIPVAGAHSKPNGFFARIASMISASNNK